MITARRKEIEQQLSSRELEIVRLMALGKARAQIAIDLKISVLTYDEHRKNIRNKLGLQSHADWARALIPFLD